MIILEDKNSIIIRIPRGKLVIAFLTNIVKKRKIKAAVFEAIGALDQVELAHYNVKKQKYNSKKFSKELELTSLIGNVSWFEGKPIIHAHATLSNPKMETIAGHFVEGRVSGTCEIYLKTLSKKIEKSYDCETGLKLMKFPT